MKKVLIAAICVLVILVGIIAADAIITKKNEITVTQVNRYTDGDVQVTETVEIPTKDRNATVQFTMPLYYLEEKYQNDLDTFCKENGYIACTIDKQAQTYTVTMNAMNHDFMLVSVGIQSIKNIANSIESEKYPFFKELNKYTDDFTEITVLVDAEGYKAEGVDRESFMAYIAGCGIYYQLYTVENEYSCEVTVKDQKTGEVIDAKVFRQNNSGVVS